MTMTLQRGARANRGYGMMGLTSSLACAFIVFVILPSTEKDGGEIDYRTNKGGAADTSPYSTQYASSFVVLPGEEQDDRQGYGEGDGDIGADVVLTARVLGTTLLHLISAIGTAGYRLLQRVPGRTYRLAQLGAQQAIKLVHKLRSHERIFALRRYVIDCMWNAENYMASHFPENGRLAILLLLPAIALVLVFIHWLQRSRSRTLSDSMRNMDTSNTPNKSRLRLWTPSSSSDLPWMNSGSDQYKYNKSSRDLIREVELEDPQTQFIMSYHESFADTQEQYHGPLVDTIVYDTVTPPPSWEKASRNLYPQDPLRLRLEREISLSLTESPVITIRELHRTSACVADAASPPNSRDRGGPSPIELPVNICSVHPKPPADGGVLEIYVKDSPREHWMEHTFDSAHDAAQFQIDLLAMQLLGDSINNLYETLKLVHQGSVAHAGKEFVLHDRVYEEKVDAKNASAATKSPYVTGGGVAWDDVMRCLGSSFPLIKSKLERLWWLEQTKSDSATAAKLAMRKKARIPEEPPSAEVGAASAGEEDGHNEHYLQSDYVNKRLLLGPVDFFRLFVPILPELEFPRSTSTRTRLEQMLRWRKRVARASVLVQAYTRARTVANRGWNLSHRPEFILKQRLSYDDNLENYLRDETARNEVYEATVSRDIICNVRSPDSLKKNPWWMFGFSGHDKPARSGYQGFTFVGFHSFILSPEEETEHPLQFGTDPLRSIPSLCEIIEANPEIEFFASCIFFQTIGVVRISLFARSLPKGIDPKFDTVVDRFKLGEEEVRDRKLEVIFQLGKDQAGVPVLAWLILMVYSLLLRLTVCSGNTRVPPAVSTGGRTSIPAIRVATLGETCHFGGSLQPDNSMPTNYVAFSVRLDSKMQSSFLSRFLIAYLEQGGLGRDVVDFTWLLAGETEDELPERVLATVRGVRIVSEETSHLARHAIPQAVETSTGRSMKVHGSTVVKNTASLYLRIFVTDPTMAALLPMIRSSQRRKNPNDNTNSWTENNRLMSSGSGLGSQSNVLVSSDPFERAVNELVEILDDVVIPIRTAQMTRFDEAQASSFSRVVDDAAEEGAARPVTSGPRNDLQQVSILRKVSRSDMRRYFVASNCRLKPAAVRIVESASWHGLTFPIAARSCRIELQNGQFFQQGRDLEGHPVFYFRNRLIGPWRKDEDAVVAAVLHRLESSLKAFAKEDPEVKCTLIVLMGRPFHEKKELGGTKKKGTGDASVTVAVTTEPRPGSADGDGPNEEATMSVEQDGTVEDDYDGETIERGSVHTSFQGSRPVHAVNNPRIHSDEQWHTHTNMELIRRLIDTVTTHYPERLHKALVVVGKGNTTYTRTAVGGMLKLPKVLSSSRTRDKVKFLIRYGDLREHVAKEELSVLVGGHVPVDPSVFEAL